MAGMLPGVECARRRRFHHSRIAGIGIFTSMPSHSQDSSSTTKSSLCLYQRNVQSPVNCSSLLERIALNQGFADENLGGAAREAKQRLDQKFAAHLRLENQRKRKNVFHDLWQQLRS